jgi:hypothetical protein
MKTIVTVVGVLSLLLGGLWLLQGLGIVHMRPILCFADCVPLQGPSSTWAVVGILVLTAGIFMIRYARKDRTRQ